MECMVEECETGLDDGKEQTYVGAQHLSQLSY